MRKTALGFTLIELLVVISIIGILATLVAANLNSARSRARDAERKSDLHSLETSLRLYYNDRGAYPKNDASFEIMGCTSYTVPASCVWGSPWAVGSISYMSKLPVDPLSSQTYAYQSTGDTYTLTACLENASDTSGTGVFSISGWTCPTNWVFQISQ